MEYWYYDLFMLSGKYIFIVGRDNIILNEIEKGTDFDIFKDNEDYKEIKNLLKRMPNKRISKDGYFNDSFFTKNFQNFKKKM